MQSHNTLSTLEGCQDLGLTTVLVSLASNIYQYRLLNSYCLKFHQNPGMDEARAPYNPGGQLRELHLYVPYIILPPTSWD